MFAVVVVSRRLTEREETNSVAIAGDVSFSRWAKTLTDQRVPASRAAVEPVSADDLVHGLWLEAMLASVDESGLRLTGEGGFLPALINLLERAPRP